MAFDRRLGAAHAAPWILAGIRRKAPLRPQTPGAPQSVNQADSTASQGGAGGSLKRAAFTLNTQARRPSGPREREDRPSAGSYEHEFEGAGWEMPLDANVIQLTGAAVGAAEFLKLAGSATGSFPLSHTAKRPPSRSRTFSKAPS